MIAVRAAGGRLGKGIVELKLETASSFASAWFLHVDCSASARAACSADPPSVRVRFSNVVLLTRTQKTPQARASTVDSSDAALSLTRDHVRSPDCPSFRLTQDSGAQLMRGKDRSLVSPQTSLLDQGASTKGFPARRCDFRAVLQCEHGRNTSGRQSAAVVAVGNRRTNASGRGVCAHTTQRR